MWLKKLFSKKDNEVKVEAPEAETSAPEATPEAAPEATPEAAPEATPEAAPEATPEAEKSAPEAEAGNDAETK